MKFTFKNSLPLVAAFFMSSAAFAGMFEVEPYLGYQLAGSVGTAAQNTAKTAASYNQLGVGLRATVKFLDMFYVGPDFAWYQGLSATQPNYTADSGVPVSNVKVTNGNLVQLGLVAGVQLPLSFRLWVGYNFLDNLTNASTGTLTVPGVGAVPYTDGKSSSSGSSFKIGAGYNIFAMLNLNAEYFFTSYGASKPSLTYGGSAHTSDKAAQTASQLLVTVSAPLNLL